MGWSKKSSGNSYDFQSGHSYEIGLYGRKIIDFCTHCKVCNLCEQARTYFYYLEHISIVMKNFIDKEILL